MMPLRMRRANDQPEPSVSINPSTSSTPDNLKNDDAEAAEDCDVREFSNPAHAHDVLECFCRLRSRGLFTDVILSTGEREFPCHRAILVAGRFRAGKLG